MKRHILLVLVASMLLSMATSCGQTEEQKDTTEIPSTETTELETTRTDRLPERNYEGRTFRVLTAAEQWQDFYINEQTGDVVDDAIYTRNLNVEERFDAVLEYDVYNGYMGGMDAVKTALSGSVLSGGGDYDLMVGSSSYVTPNIADKLMADLNVLDYLELDAPWWLQYINEEAELGGKLYYGSGYYGLLNIAWGIVTFFNKDLVTEYNLEDPYTLVLDGTWTIDKMREMCEIVLTDTNGDTFYDAETDVLGVVSTDDYICNLAVSMGCTFSEHNANGSVTVKNADERVISVNEKVFDLRKSSYYKGDFDVTYEALRNSFASNHSLFLIHRLWHADSDAFRNMENGYGIIPCVKFNEDQQHYNTSVIAESAGIPAVVTDMEASSILLEALQYESWKTVRPAYYDVMLKQKYSSDEISGQMLDLIFENTTCPFLYMYCRFVGDYPVNQIGNNENYVSWLSSRISAMQTKIDDLTLSVQED